MLNSILKSLRNITFGVALAIPVVLYPYLYFFQDKMIFFPQPINTSIKQLISKHFSNSHVEIKTADGAVLRGWLVKAAVQ